MTAGTPVPGEYLTNRQMTQSPLNVKDTLRRAKNDGADLKINQLIYHQTDFTVSPIVDNPKVCLLRNKSNLASFVNDLVIWSKFQSLYSATVTPQFFNINSLQKNTKWICTCII